jgi:hypothetical protein
MCSRDDDPTQHDYPSDPTATLAQALEALAAIEHDQWIEWSELARLRAIEGAAALDDKVLALKQVRAVVNTLPSVMGASGAVNLSAVCDIIDDAILRAALEVPVARLRAALEADHD